MKPLFAALLLVTAAPAAHANLVRNGSFETGDFTSWDQVGDTEFDSVTTEDVAGGPTEGSWHAVFGSIDPGGAGIVQTISTTVGQDYTLTFDLANLGDPPNAFGLFWNGGLAEIQFDLDPFNYTSFEYTLTATSDDTQLGFIFFNLPSFFLLDNISLVASDTTVPAPATLALFGLGALALGAARRRA